MAEEQDLIAASMAGTQQVPANFKGDDADNFEEVSARWVLDGCSRVLPRCPLLTGGYQIEKQFAVKGMIPITQHPGRLRF